MVKYLCHNCNDLLLKNITSVIDHVWAKHDVEVQRHWNLSFNQKTHECLRETQVSKELLVLDVKTAESLLQVNIHS